MKPTLKEQPLIGCILLNDKQSMSHCIRRGVEANWFEQSSVSEFYRDALAKFGQGKVIDVNTMGDGKNRLLLDGCVDAVATVLHIEAYIDDVESEHLIREARSLNLRHQDLIAVSGANVRDDLAQIRHDWMQVSCGVEQEISVVDAAEKVVEGWRNPDLNNAIVSWPLKNLQKHIGNISDEYIFLCAPESVGKTALALQMSWHLGVKGIRNSFASLESSTMRVTPRILGMIGKVNSWIMKNGKGTEADFYRCEQAIETLKKLPIELTDRSMNLDQLHAWALSEKARGSKFLCVDNMKHIRVNIGKRSTVDDFREISLRCKWIRDDIGLPIMLLHHLTDAGDVSWSKDIRRDADILLYMTENEECTIKPSKDNNYEGRWINDILVAKNRDGDRGYVLQAQFHKEIQKFEEYDEF